MSNGDVYVAGCSEDKPVLWKNGAISVLAESESYGHAYGVAVHGSDVYVVGTDDKKAVLWKNGEGSTFKEDKKGPVCWAICIEEE